MNTRRLLTYITCLIILAFALGSLPRGTPSGSLLFQSTWLLYLIYLGPIVILGIMVALIILIASNWRDIAAAIGFKMAQQRRTRKRGSRYNLFIKLFFWALAVGLLIWKPGTIFNPTHTNSTGVLADITGDRVGPPNPFLGGLLLPTISAFVQNDWFGVAFLGLLGVGGLVLVQSVRVAMKETSALEAQDLQTRQIEGLKAANYAIRLIDSKELDPRSRIVACFQSMITAVSRLGVPVSSDLTARELDAAIRSTFALRGPATSELTELFEEARYSLHDINDEDAATAREYLESITDELKIQLDAN